MFVCDENPVAHFVLFSDLRRMTDLICLDRRMTVFDENPVAQLVFFLILHGSDQSKHVKIWLSLSHHAAWNCSDHKHLHVNRLPCASALESFRPRNE